MSTQASGIIAELMDAVSNLMAAVEVNVTTLHEPPRKDIAGAKAQAALAQAALALDMAAQYLDSESAGE